MSILNIAAVALIFAVAGTSPDLQKAKPKTQKQLGSIGTSQMPGAICSFGKAYTLGKPSGSAMNVNITTAEYRATRVRTGKTFEFPKAETKLLVVHYTLHNPLPKEQQYSGTIKVTAVMPDGKNIETQRSYLEENPNSEVNQVFKPAQKLAVYSILEVPATAPVDKLILANVVDTGSLVARYPLAGLVKKIEAPYADPSDPAGFTPLKVMKVPMGKPFEIATQDVAVMKVEEIAEKGESFDAPPEGRVYVLITFQVTCKNEEGGWMTNFGGGWLYSEISDVDGGTYGTSNLTFRPSSTGEFNPRIDFGATGTFRKAYEVSKGVKLDYIRLKEFDSRELRFDLRGFTTSK